MRVREANFMIRVLTSPFCACTSKPVVREAAGGNVVDREPSYDLHAIETAQRAQALGAERQREEARMHRDALHADFRTTPDGLRALSKGGRGERRPAS